MMRLPQYRLKFFFIFYTLFFLFYPGNNYYFHIFAYHRDLFLAKDQKISLKKTVIPYLKSQYFLPSVTAEGIYVVDLASFTPVLKKNEKNRFYPASLTKIITALVALDIYKPDEIIVVKNPITEGQIMGLVNDERITVENLLYGILIHSANDAAYALSDNFGQKKFIELMNKKVKELSMNQTYFTNPSGFDDINHYTTPFDMALAGRALLNNPYLKKIVSIKEITISDVDFKYFHHLVNVNKLLGEISGLGGLKTGYTEDAGENLVSFYKNNNHQWIIVVLKSYDRFSDTKEIINWINTNINYLEIN